MTRKHESLSPNDVSVRRKLVKKMRVSVNQKTQQRKFVIPLAIRNGDHEDASSEI